MRKIINLLPLLVVIAGLTGLIYLSVQQDIRQGANDPQIQVAEDAARGLNSGRKVSEMIFPNIVSIDQSLSPFVIVYDDNKKPLTNAALLHDTTPTLPDGVFDYVKGHGQERVTWQPEKGVRIAAVITKYNGGYVLAGRNMREIEIREDRLLKQVVLGGLVILGLSIGLNLLFLGK